MSAKNLLALDTPIVSFVTVYCGFQVNVPFAVVAEVETTLETAIENFDEYRNKDNLLDNPYADTHMNAADPFGPTVQAQDEKNGDVSATGGDNTSASPQSPSNVDARWRAASSGSNSANRARAPSSPSNLDARWRASSGSSFADDANGAARTRGPSRSKSSTHAPSRSMINPSRSVPRGVPDPILIERVPGTIFRRAQNKVFQLMEKDPFVRCA